MAALADRYDVALLDLDGVVYIGSKAVEGAPQTLRLARERGMRLTFVTNNASRTPQAIAVHLTELGIVAAAEEVVTSAQAAAHYLAERLPVGAAVLVLGASGLIEALRERALRPVMSANDAPVAVVQGYSPDLDWHQLAEGAIAIQRGIPWIATNLDPTVPSARGQLPGNGSLVAALRHATGVTPIATGKPDPTMHRETVERSGARRPLVVGDRLDTDIEGATAVGCDSLLVLSGVTSPTELLAAVPHRRPDYIAHDLSGLLQSHPSVAAHGGSARCGRWMATATADVIELSAGSSARPADVSPHDDVVDALRALCVVAWTSAQPGSPCPSCRFADDAARVVLAGLGLG